MDEGEGWGDDYLDYVRGHARTREGGIKTGERERAKQMLFSKNKENREGFTFLLFFERVLSWCWRKCDVVFTFLLLFFLGQGGEGVFYCF